MKHCNGCGETKSLDDFHRRRDRPIGRQARCKPCVKEVGKASEAANPGRKLELARAWAAANPERIRGFTRKWYAANRERAIEGVQAWQGEQPNRRKAIAKVNDEIRAGRMARGTECETCGKTENIHGHHDSYDREHWLNVRWLCAGCHKKHHLDERKRIAAAAMSADAQ